jgi:hypothetical protein
VIPQKLLEGEDHQWMVGEQYQVVVLGVKRLSLEAWEWDPESLQVWREEGKPGWQKVAW